MYVLNGNNLSADLSGDAPVFHDPLVSSPVLASVTAIVPEAPGAVHERLLAEPRQLAGVEEQGPLQSANSAETPARATD